MTAVSTEDFGARGGLDHGRKLDLNQPMGMKTALGFLAVLAIGLFFTAYSIYTDVAKVGTPVTTLTPFLLLP